MIVVTLPLFETIAWNCSECELFLKHLPCSYTSAQSTDAPCKGLDSLPLVITPAECKSLPRPLWTYQSSFLWLIRQRSCPSGDTTDEGETKRRTQLTILVDGLLSLRVAAVLEVGEFGHANGGHVTSVLVNDTNVELFGLAQVSNGFLLVTQGLKESPPCGSTSTTPERIMAHPSLCCNTGCRSRRIPHENSTSHPRRTGSACCSALRDPNSHNGSSDLAITTTP